MAETEFSPPPSSSVVSTEDTSPSPTVPATEVSAPAVVEPVKKSWAALVRPKDDEKPSGPPRPGGSPNMMAFVVTSEENKRQKDLQKFERLGEILFSRNLIDRKLDHRTVFLTPRGMLNRGNTCYMNAVLQTLIFCPPFYHLLEALDVASSTQTAELPPIVDCFVNLAKCFRKLPNLGGKKGNLRAEDTPLDPAFLYDTFEQHAPDSAHQQMLSRGAQEDAQESLNYILLMLHEEMVKGIASLTENQTNQINEKNQKNEKNEKNQNEKNEINQINSGQQTNQSQDLGEWTSISKGQKKSILRECQGFKESPVSFVFGGKLRSIRKHYGARDAENVEPFFMLGLPIHDSRVNSVFQAMERFMGSETLHGFQDRGREVSAQRQYRFEEVPSVFILHLKYFEFTNENGFAKLQKNIHFDTFLTLPERWFAEKHFNRSKSNFQLSAVIFHYGEGLGGGHYTACFFHPASPTGWLEANDSTVSVVGFDYIRQPQYHRVPYLLFYRLQANNNS